MPTYRVHRNPRRADDYVEVNADGFMEEGSYTKFIDSDGGVALAIPTQYVTKIQEVKEN